MRAAVDRAQVSSVVKRYGRQRALAGVDLDISAGRMCALLGANGAGKSTLLGILSTLVRPTSGDVVFSTAAGESLKGAALRREIGILAHDALLYSQLSAVENLQFYARLYSVESVAERIEVLLDEVGLDQKARVRAAGTYSRGMTQRLSLARALLHEPTVLLLDEPFTGLDRVGAAALARSLAGAKARGTVMIVVTHDLESIADITDHVVILKRGKIAHEEIRGDGAAGFSYLELKEIYHRFSE